jgi:hypothetical protein
VDNRRWWRGSHREERHQTVPKHEEQSDSGATGDDAGEVVYDMLLPRLPPKLKAPESLFVPQEICSLEKPPLDSLPLRRASLWQYYTKAYRREVGASVVVACKNPARFKPFAVKCIAGSEVNDQAQPFVKLDMKISSLAMKYLCVTMRSLPFPNTWQSL